MNDFYPANANKAELTQTEISNLYHCLAEKLVMVGEVRDFPLGEFVQPDGSLECEFYAELSPEFIARVFVKDDTQTMIHGSISYFPSHVLGEPPDDGRTESVSLYITSLVVDTEGKQCKKDVTYSLDKDEQISNDYDAKIFTEGTLAWEESEIKMTRRDLAALREILDYLST